MNVFKKRYMYSVQLLAVFGDERRNYLIKILIRFYRLPQFTTVLKICMKMKTVHVIVALLMISCMVSISEGGRKVQKRK